jgi:hypothetical protein
MLCLLKLLVNTNGMDVHITPLRRILIIIVNVMHPPLVLTLKAGHPILNGDS